MRQPGLGTLQHYWVIPLYDHVRFARWDKILNFPEPAQDLIYPRGVWHYARGMAHIGYKNLERAEDLPWDDESFDVVVSQFGLMFFDDQQKALREMFRILKSEGRLVVTVFDSLDNIPGYKIMIRIFGQVAGEEVAQALRFPFSLGEIDVLKSLCFESALRGAKINTFEGKARFPDVRTMVLADVKGWFPLAGFVLDEHQIDDRPPGFEELRYHVYIGSTASEEEVQKVIDKADRHSPVLDDFKRAIPVEREVTITTIEKEGS